MGAEQFIPILLATFGLAYVAFKSKKKNKNWLIIAFIIWLMAFLWTIGAFR